jgi:type II secretory pathway pseudopilin PulG
VKPILGSKDERGFSIVEMLVAVLCMLVVTSAVLSLVKSSMQVANATYELTDAWENLRISQEYINRDLMNAGDGLKSMTYIPVNTSFVQNYLSLTPIADATMPSGVTNLGILTTDNNVPANTAVPQPSTSPTPVPILVRAGTDRQTILQIDPDPSNIQYTLTSVSTNGSILTLPSGATMTNFTVGEIYFITSARGGTFGAITAIDSTNKQLTFGAGDPCGLNTVNGRIKDIAYTPTGTAIPTALQRMKIIHYYVDSNNLLRRREFGIRGAAYRDSIIAEHVLSVQFVYSIGLDVDGNPVQPTSLLTTPAQQVAISQVEVNITVETPHGIRGPGAVSTASPTPTPANPTLSGTTSTSLRNMQFRQALQPRPSPTP